MFFVYPVDWEPGPFKIQNSRVAHLDACLLHSHCHDSAPADAYISWPVDHHAIAGVANTGDEDEEPDLVAMTHLPPGPDAHAFLVSHSPDDPELLAGLCLYSEVFLSKVGTKRPAVKQSASRTEQAYAVGMVCMHKQLGRWSSACLVFSAQAL